jgi:hypothetical protein
VIKVFLPNVLPMEKSTITSDGIDFKGVLYTCPLAIKEQWFLPQENNEERGLSACFDPANPDLLLLLIEEVGLIPAYKKLVLKPMAPEMLEAYFSAFNALKSEWKLKRNKNRKRGVKK